MSFLHQISEVPLAKSTGALLLFVFAALVIVCASYFVLSYLTETSSEFEDLMAVKEDKKAAEWAFSVIGVISVVGFLGLIIGGVVLRRDGDKDKVEEPQVSQSISTTTPTAPPEITLPSEFTVVKGKLYMAEELIKLYQHLPEHAVIRCNLEIDGKFEACTVLDSLMVSLKGTGAAGALETHIKNALQDTDHYIAQCCRDNYKSTVMFTTLAKDQFVDSIGIEMQDCLSTDCTAHIADKIARNQRYQDLANSPLAGCQFDESAEEDFDPVSNRQSAADMLLKYTLTSPPHKLAQVYVDRNDRDLFLQTFFNGGNENGENTDINEVPTDSLSH